MSCERNVKFWEEFWFLYRSHPCLWSTKNKHHSDKHSKQEAYDELVQKCKEIDGSANKDYVLRKINNFRTAFRREYKKVKASKGSSTGEHKPSLWYFDLLMFTVEDDAGTQERLNVKNENTGEVIYEEDDIQFMDDQYDNTSTSPPQSSAPNNMQWLAADSPSILIGNSQAKRGGNVTSDNRRMDILETPCSTMAVPTQTEDDEYDFVGKRQALQLRGMTDERQRLIPEKRQVDVIEPTRSAIVVQPQDHDEYDFVGKRQALQLRGMADERQRLIPEKRKLDAMEPPRSTIAVLPQNEDEYDVVGKRLAFQFRGMTDERQRLIAEKLVSDVMFHGRMGNLTEQSLVVVSKS